MDDTNSLIEQRQARPAALRVVLLTVGCVLLTGCFDTKQDITLNPDGTGKVVIDSTFAQTQVLFDRSSIPPDWNNVTNLVRKLIEEAEGADAWREIDFQQQEDGKLHFRGTAYFQDLSKFKFGMAVYHRFAVTKDAAGNLTITIFSDGSFGASPEANPFAQKTNEPVTAESIQLERAKARTIMPMLQATLGAMKQDTVFHLPGVVRRSSNFETPTPQTLRIRLDGAKLVKTGEDRLFDTSLDTKRIAGEKFSANDDAMNEKVYGQKAPVIAVIKPGNLALFDYAAEVAEARKSFPEISRMLGMTGKPKPAPKPAVDGAPATVRVTGIQWQFESDDGTRFVFDRVKRGYIINLKAELPGSVFTVTKVQLNRATTMEGASLLPEKSAWNESPNPRLLPGASNVTFRACLELPPMDSKGIAELSGFLECSTAESPHTVELVFGKLRGGTKGAQFDVQIEDVRPYMAGGEKIVVRTTLGSEQLRSLKIIGDAGQVAKLENHGHMTVGNDHTYTYLSRTGIPRTGKIIAEVSPGTQTLRIPFALTNVTLLGQPLTK